MEKQLGRAMSGRNQWGLGELAANWQKPQPSAYVILDNFGRTGYLIWAMVYPVIVGLISAGSGFLIFKRGDYS